MTNLIEFLSRPIPRPLMVFGAPILAFFLITLFVFMGFPYDRVADYVVSRIESASNTKIEFERISPRVTIGGPGFKVEHLDITTSDGSVYRVNPLTVRPAWSTSWFSGAAAIHAALESEMGNLDGTFTLGSNEQGWTGRVEDVDMALIQVPPSAQIEMSGLLDAEADLVLIGGQPAGELIFEARDGAFVHGSVPMPIDFDTLVGEISLGGKHLAQIAQLDLKGPIAAASISGDISPGAGARKGRTLLDLEIDLTIVEPGMQTMLRNLGVGLDDTGAAHFSIGGTLASPKMR